MQRESKRRGHRRQRLSRKDDCHRRTSPGRLSPQNLARTARSTIWEEEGAPTTNHYLSFDETNTALTTGWSRKTAGAADDGWTSNLRRYGATESTVKPPFLSHVHCHDVLDSIESARNTFFGIHALMRRGIVTGLQLPFPPAVEAGGDLHLPSTGNCALIVRPTASFRPHSHHPIPCQTDRAFPPRRYRGVRPGHGAAHETSSRSFVSVCVTPFLHQYAILANLLLLERPTCLIEMGCTRVKSACISESAASRASRKRNWSRTVKLGGSSVGTVQ